MSELVENTLREVLVDDGRVALPSLGTFIRENHSAVLSGADRKIIPPSARVVFNENLVVNDGRLLRALVEQKGLLRGNAEREMQSFITDVRGRLKNGEHVALQGVGQLFKQFDDRIAFTSAAIGLSKKDFGLPTVSFTPVLRGEEQHAVDADPLAGGNFGATAAGSKTPSAPPPPPRVAPGSWETPPLKKISATGIWYAVAIILMMLMLWAVWGLIGGIGSTLTDDPKAPTVKRERARTAERPINNSGTDPARSNSGTTTMPPVPASTVAPAEPPRLNSSRRAGASPSASPTTQNPSSRAEPTTPTQSSRSTTTTPAGNAAAGGNTAIIAIGLYGNQENVDKNVQRIKQAGFVPFTEKKGRYTRVGVQAKYSTVTERDRTLQQVRDRFTKDAFIMRVNGRAFQ